MRSVLSRTLALLTFPVLASCGGGKDCCSPPPNGNGNFTASVTGAKSASLAGEAGFLTGANVFTIALRDASSAASYIQISHTGAVPAPGTYSLDPNGDPAQSFAVIYSGGGTDNYGGTGGTLTLTTVSGTNLRGDFTFTAKGGSSGSAAVSVTGHFDATRLTAP